VTPDAPPPRGHVVVLGGGVAGLTAALRLRQGGATVTLVEAGPRPGGKLLTLHADGFTVELGPDVFLARKGTAAELCREVGLGDDLVGVSSRALIRRGSRLHPLPEGFTGLVPGRVLPLATSPLLPLRARLRAALEPFIPARRDGGDESVEAFVVRRFGRGVYDHLAEPLLGGLYGSDSGPISVLATLPHLRAMEARHGSLVRAFARARRGGDGPPFQTLAGGLSRLADALTRALLDAGAEVRTQTSAHTLSRTKTGFLVGLDDGTGVPCDAVAVALPAPAAADLLEGLDGRFAAPLRAIPYGSIGVAAFAYDADAVPRPPEATGYLVPRREGGPVQAVTVFSAKHPGSAPPGAVLFRVFVRPGADGRLAGEPDLLAAAAGELRRTLGVTARPLWQHAHPWEYALPRYTLGHPARLAALAALEEAHPGLALTGAAYHGAGLPDVIASAEAAADRLLASDP
jgi:protoporphyrinogen/coproporphyrinogen III oxidase